MLLIALLIGLAAAALPPDQQRAALMSKLLSQYDPNVRPYPNNITYGPTVVDVQYRLNLLFNIDSKQETWTADLYITESWLDRRLSFNGTNDWPANYGELKIRSYLML